jgi:hypothetical protein
MLINCSNKKCKGDRRTNQQVFDCQILNEMIGREVIRNELGHAICIDCIPAYYQKTYEEIVANDQSVKIDTKKTSEFNRISNLSYADLDPTMADSIDGDY